MKDIFQKTNTLVIISILFLATSVIFQNCTPNKMLNDSSSTGSDTQTSMAALVPRSLTGNQVIVNGQVVLKEYRHKPSNRFFYTTRTADQNLLEAQYSNLFEVTGVSIKLTAADGAGLSPIYRLFNKAGYHLYTADTVEYNTTLSDSNWLNEGIEGYAIKINPGSTCPTTPNVSYPVNRFFHNGSYKYRLVADITLKNQLLAQGYVDQGVLFCAPGVVTTPIPEPIITPPVTPPVSGGTASCAFGNTTLAHGATAPGYASATVPNGSNCVSQSVTCTNGVLSNPSYAFNSCSVLPAETPVGADLCAGQTVYTGVAMSPNLNFERRTTGYWFSDSRDIPPGMSDGDIVVIPFNVTAAMTTQAGWPSNLEYSDIGATRAGKIVSISQRKCDFSATVKLWISPPVSLYPGGVNSSSNSFVLNDTSAGHSQYTNLTTGQWYINVKLPRGSCPANTKCDIVLDYHGIGSN